MNRRVSISLLAMLLANQFVTATAGVQNPNVERAVASYRMSIADMNLDEFLSSIRASGKKLQFAIRTGHPSRKRNDFVVVDFFRYDLRITVTNPFEPNEFIMAIYPGYQSQTEAFTLEASSEFVRQVSEKVQEASGGYFRKEK